MHSAKVLAVLLVVGAALVMASLAIASNGASVTKATLPSSWNDVPMTCDETQVINANQRKETFQCQLPPQDVGEAQVYDCSAGEAFWFSDFDGAPATDCHITIAPNGRFNGWATY